MMWSIRSTLFMSCLRMKLSGCGSGSWADYRRHLRGLCRKTNNLITRLAGQWSRIPTSSDIFQTLVGRPKSVMSFHGCDRARRLQQKHSG